MREISKYYLTPYGWSWRSYRKEGETQIHFKAHRDIRSPESSVVVPLSYVFHTLGEAVLAINPSSELYSRGYDVILLGTEKNFGSEEIVDNNYRNNLGQSDIMVKIVSRDGRKGIYIREGEEFVTGTLVIHKPHRTNCLAAAIEVPWIDYREDTEKEEVVEKEIPINSNSSVDVKRLGKTKLVGDLNIKEQIELANYFNVDLKHLGRNNPLQLLENALIGENSTKSLDGFNYALVAVKKFNLSKDYLYLYCNGLNADENSEAYGIIDEELPITVSDECMEKCAAKLEDFLNDLALDMLKDTGYEYSNITPEEGFELDEAKKTILKILKSNATF